MKHLLSTLALLAVFFLTGCAHHEDDIIPKPIPIPVQDNNPFGSAEIKGCAKSLVPDMLMSDALNAEDENGDPRLIRIVVKPMVNESTLRLNVKMITNGIKQEFAAVAKAAGYSQVRFVNESKQIIDKTHALSKEKLPKRIDAALDAAAENLLRAPMIANAAQPPVIAIIPSVTTNLVNMNANSFIKLLRAKIADKANGRVLFTEAGTLGNADYYLMGDFIAESMKTEGIVNLADYITLMEDRVRQGKDMDFIQQLNVMEQVTEQEFARTTTSTLTYAQYRTLLGEVRESQSLREMPNVSKHLNVMLLRPSDKVAVFEKMIQVDQAATDHLENVDFILSGSLTSVSHREVNREEMIYVVANLVLVDENGEEIWTGSYESKKLVPRSVVY